MSSCASAMADLESDAIHWCRKAEVVVRMTRVHSVARQLVRQGKARNADSKATAPTAKFQLRRLMATFVAWQEFFMNRINTYEDLA